MKFIENFQERAFGVIALDKKELETLRERLSSDSETIPLEDLFDDDSYKIESIKVVSDWEGFRKESGLKDKNVVITTLVVKTSILVIIGLACYGLYNIIF